MLKKILVVCVLLLLGCNDKSFEHFPRYTLGNELISPRDIYKSTSVVENGLFARQLQENGYRDLLGHSILDPTEVTNGNYLLVFLSCTKSNKHTELVATIDATFHSIIDVFTFDPQRYIVHEIMGSAKMASFIDIQMRELHPSTSENELILIQVTSQGKFTEMTMCCDF